MATRPGETQVPDQCAIRTELARIAASPPFDTSPKLTSFLCFVVESTLPAGVSGSRVIRSASSIGARRDFNPQIDPIVRVEAIRLRAALARYYSGAGAGDPVIIEIPRGHYIPYFSHRLRRGRPGLMTWRKTVHAIRHFLMLRVTIQVRAVTGKLAAPGPRLLPTAAIAPQATPDGRQDQQAEGPAAARARRSRSG